MSYAGVGAAGLGVTVSASWEASLSSSTSKMPPGCSMQNLQNWLKTVRSRAGLTQSLPLSATGILDANTIRAFRWFASAYEVPANATLSEVCIYLASLQDAPPAGRRPSRWSPISAPSRQFIRPDLLAAIATPDRQFIRPGLFTTPEQAPVYEEGGMAPVPEEESSMTTWLIVGGVLLVGAGAFFVMRKKR